ncbi:hypothetical protein [Kosmotoga pacifica]|uniref:DUF1858 domain-containing protein n=1 Tax=Kosmotoga pacifica TaxID=1330330 RepID=A0A0G2Z7Y7_9BACT|nr:hypothetical protein [Kosmotoga pacifica]AKI97715.1 hypothetical protein IX53_07690 [Kosmotoga pacifica]
MLPEITKDMTLNDIMNLHTRLYEEIGKLGFDICCAKMDTLEDACKKKGLDLQNALRTLNAVVEEMNEIERIIREAQ